MGGACRTRVPPAGCASLNSFWIQCTQCCRRRKLCLVTKHFLRNHCRLLLAFGSERHKWTAWSWEIFLSALGKCCRNCFNFDKRLQRYRCGKLKCTSGLLYSKKLMSIDDKPRSWCPLTSRTCRKCRESSRNWVWKPMTNHWSNYRLIWIDLYPTGDWFH